MARQPVRNTPAKQVLPRLTADFADLLRSLARSVLDPYRPELHYMRGPGPKWHAKHEPCRSSSTARRRWRAFASRADVSDHRVVPGSRTPPVSRRSRIAVAGSATRDGRAARTLPVSLISSRGDTL